MKPWTEKYHYCRYCKRKYDNFRLYIRTRKLESHGYYNTIKPKRGFKAIGWYCESCKVFETDDMIRRRSKQNLLSQYGQDPNMSDEDYDKWLNGMAKGFKM